VKKTGSKGYIDVGRIRLTEGRGEFVSNQRGKKVDSRMREPATYVYLMQQETPKPKKWHTKKKSPRHQAPYRQREGTDTRLIGGKGGAHNNTYREIGKKKGT